MKVIYNNLIPFKGYIAMNLFGVFFVRGDNRDKFTDDIINHEFIHTAQMRELLYVGFYIVYLLEWLYRLAFHRDTAYHGISFEKEAREHEKEHAYLLHRKPFAQWRRKS